MSLINGITVDGSLVKETFNGIRSAANGIRELITGQLAPDKAAEIEMKLAEIDSKSADGQTEVNKIEAANPNVFVSGARPFIVWVCGISLACYYIPQALMASILWTMQCYKAMQASTNIAALVLPAYPIAFNVGEIMGLVASILGLGGFRMIEKIKNVARS